MGRGDRTALKLEILKSQLHLLFILFLTLSSFSFLSRSCILAGSRSTSWISDRFRKDFGFPSTHSTSSQSSIFIWFQSLDYFSNSRTSSTDLRTSKETLGRSEIQDLRLDKSNRINIKTRSKIKREVRHSNHHSNEIDSCLEN